MGFTNLMMELYQRAKAESPPLLVTAAMRATPRALNHYELPKVHNYIDYIFLMSYDYHGMRQVVESSTCRRGSMLCTWRTLANAAPFSPHPANLQEARSTRLPPQ